MHNKNNSNEQIKFRCTKNRSNTQKILQIFNKTIQTTKIIVQINITI